MSRSSLSSCSAPAETTFATRAMPHFGQVAGSSLSTPSHIGQKYPLEAVASARAWQGAASS
jgi:hypothetical protein